MKIGVVDRVLGLARAPSSAGPPLDELIPRDVLSFVRRYLPFELSPAWETFIRAYHGADEVDAHVAREIFGNEKPRAGGFDRALVVAGRRSAKTQIAAVLALFEVVVVGPEHMRYLAPGQRGYGFVLSKTVKQGGETFRAARAIVERNPELTALLAEEPLESQGGGELRFRSGVVLSVFAASKGSTRGFTVIAAVLDEWAFIASDDQSADQDSAIMSAIEFGMIAPRSAPMRRMLAISSPAGRSGAVFELFKEHHGKADAPWLVAHGPTWTFNPTITKEQLEPQRRRDPRTFAREVEAEFADSVSAWCESTVIIAARNGRELAPLPPGPWVYAASADIAFRRDQAVLCIGHAEQATPRGPAPVTGVWDPVSQREVLTIDVTAAPDRRFVVDGFWRWVPTPGNPLDASAVVTAMAAIARAYRCGRLSADQFAIVPLQNEFQRHGLRLIEHVMSSRSKFEIFTRLRESFYAGALSLPADDVATKELVELQERILPSGATQVSHPDRSSAHDDHAHALALLHAQLLESGRDVPEVEFGDVRHWLRR